MFARDKRIGPRTYVYLVENARGGPHPSSASSPISDAGKCRIGRDETEHQGADRAVGHLHEAVAAAGGADQVPVSANCRGDGDRRCGADADLAHLVAEHRVVFDPMAVAIEDKWRLNARILQPRALRHSRSAPSVAPSAGPPVICAGLARFAYVDVKMALPWLGVMCVLLVIEFHRNSNQFSVPHPTLGNDMLGKVADVAHRAF
jgi:hypothetical protein